MEKFATNDLYIAMCKYIPKRDIYLPTRKRYLLDLCRTNKVLNKIPLSQFEADIQIIEESNRILERNNIDAMNVWINNYIKDTHTISAWIYQECIKWSPYSVHGMKEVVIEKVTEKSIFADGREWKICGSRKKWFSGKDHINYPDEFKC